MSLKTKTFAPKHAIAICWLTMCYRRKRARKTSKGQKDSCERARKRGKSTESDSSDDLSSDSTEPDDGVQLRPTKYKLPERKSKYRQEIVPQNKAPRQRRGTRQRRATDRFQAGQYDIRCREYIFTVNPKDVLYI